jgi:hypothetical protein
MDHCHFRENRLSESQILLKKFIKFLPILSASYDLGDIRYERSEDHSVEHVKQCKNHRTEGHTFLTSLNEIAFMRVPFNCKILRKSRRPREIFCVTSRSTRVEIQFFLFTLLHFNCAPVLLYLLSKFRWENCCNYYTRTDIQLQ